MTTQSTTSPTGGTATSNTNPFGALSTALSPGAGQSLGRESSLSEWAGPYVTDMLGKTKALSASPFQVYQGPLTAGSTPLQDQAFKGIGGLSVPSAFGQAQDIFGDVAKGAAGMNYAPGSFGNQFNAPGAYQAGTFDGGIFGTPQAQQYMNPYLQTALNPMMDEARRQAQITRLGDAGRLARAGAYGGGRQAIMESELNRNLMTKQNEMLTQGYNTAYDKAANIFNQDATRSLEAQRMGEQSRQFGAGQGMTAAQLGAQYGLEGLRAAEQAKQFGASYGLQGLGQRMQAGQGLATLGNAQGEQQRQNLMQMLTAGNLQRAIESEGLAADKAAFEEQRDYPYKMLQFEQSMLQGMPIAAYSNQTQQPSTLSNVVNTTGGLIGLYEKLFGGK